MTVDIEVLVIDNYFLYQCLLNLISTVQVLATKVCTYYTVSNDKSIALVSCIKFLFVFFCQRVIIHLLLTCYDQIKFKGFYSWKNITLSSKTVIGAKSKTTSSINWKFDLLSIECSLLIDWLYFKLKYFTCRLASR